MQVWNRTGQPKEGLWSALELDPARERAVTLVGGGGKTSLLFALAWQAAREGRRVAVTTTTHIHAHPGLPLAGDPEELAAYLKRYPVVTYGVHWRSGKLAPAGGLEDCLELADVVLIEGDGARGLPLKAPESHEPVIPAWTAAVAAVAGLDALGRPIVETCHRPARVAALLDKSPEMPVGEEDVALLLSHPCGGRKAVPEGAKLRCVLNKADDAGRLAAGLRIAGMLNVPCVVTKFDERERGGLCWF